MSLSKSKYEFVEEKTPRDDTFDSITSLLNDVNQRDRFGNKLPKTKPFKRNNRNLDDFKGVEAYVPEHLKEPEPESIDLSMKDDEEGQQFKIVSSNDYLTLGKEIAKKGKIDIA